MSFTNQAGISIIHQMIDTIQTHAQYLSEIDGAIGDGDHGINLNKGFTLVKESLQPTTTLSEGLALLVQALMGKIGGSMGPLYGSFFLGMQMVVQDQAQIEDDTVIKMLTGGYENLQQITPAKPGDKTLIDVLDPAINTLKKTYASTKDLTTALKACQQAAKEGMLATKEMVAKLGRASRLQERSLGHQDAGATSCALLIEAICEAIIQLEDVCNV